MAPTSGSPACFSYESSMQPHLRHVWQALQQPSTLPAELVATLTSTSGADSACKSLYLCIGVTTLCWLAFLLTGNCSHVDRAWSIVPAVYAAVYVLQVNAAGALSIAGASPRVLVMACLVAAWAARLTFNFARKGGYSLNAEDYRWEVLRKQLHPIVWHLFNLLFVAITQHALLWAISVPPLHIATSACAAPWNALDTAATCLFLLFLLGETVADQQQWEYQSAKHALLNARRPLPPPYAKGFLASGLFRCAPRWPSPTAQLVTHDFECARSRPHRFLHFIRGICNAPWHPRTLPSAKKKSTNTSKPSASRNQNRE